MLPLPGPTAAQLDLRGLQWSIASIAFVLVAVLSSIAVPPTFKLAAVVAVVAIFVGGLVVGQVYLSKATSKERDEAKLGYSTLHDVEGYELRDRLTGALIREKDEPPQRPSTARAYDMFTRTKD